MYEFIFAGASDAHKKGYKGLYYPTKTVGYLKR